MPTFDPTKPAANAPIVSAELRNQLNAVNDTATTAQSTASTTALTVNNWKANLLGIAQITTSYTDPVSASDLTELRDKINELILDLTT